MTHQFSIRVISADGSDQIRRFHQFLLPFSSNPHLSSSLKDSSNSSSSTLTVSRANVVCLFRFDDVHVHNGHINNNPAAAEPSDVTVMLCDSAVEESFYVVADYAGQLALPMVSLLVVDINGGARNESSSARARNPQTAANEEDSPLDDEAKVAPETLRAELHAHLTALPEFCAVLSIDVAASFSSSSHSADAGARATSDSCKKRLTFGSPAPARSPGAVSSSSALPPPSPPPSLLVAPEVDHALDTLFAALQDAALCPRHVLWSGEGLSVVGRKALRRSFWLLDRDNDGVLCEQEQVQLLFALYGSYSTDDIAEVKEFMQRIVNHQVEKGGADPGAVRDALLTPGTGSMTLMGFFGIAHVMLMEARHKLVWQMLAAHGVQPDGRPYREDDIARAVHVPENGRMRGQFSTHQLHLSDAGAAFFASLYHTRPKQRPKDLFIFTPGCPWRAVYGLPDADENSVTVVQFVRCWRFMATVDPAVVAVYARYWDFSGALSSLYVAHPMRRFRHKVSATNQQQSSRNKSTSDATSSSSVPPTATFLVLGSGHSGVSSLMQYLANPSSFFYLQQQQGEDEEHREQQQQQQQQNMEGTVQLLQPPHLQHLPRFSSGRSVAIFPAHTSSSSSLSAAASGLSGGSHSSEVHIVLRELDDAEAADMIADRSFMDTIDGVLLCYDGSDPYSFGYAAGMLPRLSKLERLPLVPVMLKGDMPPEDQIGLVHGPEQMLAQYNLPWPPVIVSVAAAAAATAAAAIAASSDSSDNNRQVVKQSLQNNIIPTTGLYNSVDSLSSIMADLVGDPDLLQRLMTLSGSSNNMNKSLLMHPRTKGGALDKSQRGDGDDGDREGGSGAAVGPLRWVKRALVLGAVGYGCYQTVSWMEGRDKFWSNNFPWLTQVCIRARRTAKNAVPEAWRAAVAEGTATLADSVRCRLVSALGGTVVADKKSSNGVT